MEYKKESISDTKNHAGQIGLASIRIFFTFIFYAFCLNATSEVMKGSNVLFFAEIWKESKNHVLFVIGKLNSRN